jgi:alpha-amylase/alpha-mannosidase (GH57 family)
MGGAGHAARTGDRERRFDTLRQQLQAVRETGGLMEKYICIHGHFYQPPRENPWLEEVEAQDSAYPYHDWNDRINAECYAPNTASRIIDGEGKVNIIGNNYASISFNFGPTLLSWMERHAPDTYQSIQDAERLSSERFSGHGSAMAQAYNHIIMPLANRRDKYTQIFWGIRDFEHRFNRYPEGVWLPETAVDSETLDICAELGILFTILSPYQASAVRKIGNGQWHEATGGKIDPTMPYRCHLPSGRHIAIFFYDGPISNDIAFGGLLRRGENFAHRLVSAFSPGDPRPQLVHIATDGETYGHHHKFGDMALGYCLHYIQKNHLAVITNYGEYLARHPPTHEVRIAENTSWSCAHGIERWRSDCGCNSGAHPSWNQAWRAPLRHALDWLRDTLVPFYEAEAGRFFYDPWVARNDYIGIVLHRSQENLETFFNEHSSRELSEEEKVRALQLLELQRNAMLMYTSCGWFFDEISGIETVQVLQYACRVIQLAEALGSSPLEQAFILHLRKASSNLPQLGDGARVYERHVKPALVDFMRLGAHYAIASLFKEYPEKTQFYCYAADSDIYRHIVSGKAHLFVLRARLQSVVTREQARISAAVLHLGDHNINCGVHYYSGEESSHAMRTAITETFERADMLGVIKLMEQYFDANNYSLADLFRDEQRKLLGTILQPTLDRIYNSVSQICGDNCAVIDFLQNLNMPIPNDMLRIMSYKANVELKRMFSDGMNVAALETLIDEVGRWSLKIEAADISLKASAWINGMMEKIERHPDGIALMDAIAKTVGLLGRISVPLNLWKTQNIYFMLDQNIHHRSPAGPLSDFGSRSEDWISAFHRLGEQLRIRELP